MSSNTPNGPSPIVPLLLVVGLGLLLRGNSSSITTLNLPLVSEGENAIFTCFIFIPILVLIAAYSTSHTILLPLALILVTYTVTTMLLGPLMLILIIYLAGAYLASVKCNGEELGWGCVLVLVFFLLHWVLSEEGRQSGALVLAIMVFLCYHCFP
ncbi:hypothetical protein CDL12_19503 [Handroanthus impetiginosus]|uniref:Uncharacterized protein n=1 Tax=Handroanthus impetiginosus TaxID=429701 RepID=A0A2G9GRK0_9LAMI|nr:hypothetical protein CDL12_19503 [Handroanthus impetiginosus]